MAVLRPLMVSPGRNFYGAHLVLRGVNHLSNPATITAREAEEPESRGA